MEVSSDLIKKCKEDEMYNKFCIFMTSIYLKEFEEVDERFRKHYPFIIKFLSCEDDYDDDLKKEIKEIYDTDSHTFAMLHGYNTYLQSINLKP